MRLVEGHDRISDARRRASPRKRAWGAFSTGGSRGIRESEKYVREGRRCRPHHADPGGGQRVEGAGVGMQRVEQHDHAQASGKTTTYGKVAEAAAKLEVPKDIKLKDPKDWKIAGKPLKRLDTADKVIGKMEYGIDVKLPGMLQRLDQGSARCSAAR